MPSAQWRCSRMHDVALYKCFTLFYSVLFDSSPLPDEVRARCRVLAEKHRALMHLYNDESQANKRLSMDRDELMWRLGHECPTTTRSLGRPAAVPTRSAPGTPRSEV